MFHLLKIFHGYFIASAALVAPVALYFSFGFQYNYFLFLGIFILFWPPMDILYEKVKGDIFDWIKNLYAILTIIYFVYFIYSQTR